MDIDHISTVYIIGKNVNFSDSYKFFYETIIFQLGVTCEDQNNIYFFIKIILSYIRFVYLSKQLEYFTYKGVIII